ncbi:hypothetical protein Q6284_33150, partial [Klebsiella pneumoniae]|nr:hypothetical protein [Klebsiella pneumoniae]
CCYDLMLTVMILVLYFTSQHLEDLANYMIEEFHIEQLRDSLGQSLSGGDRRRVEFVQQQILYRMQANLRQFSGLRRAHTGE